MLIKIKDQIISKWIRLPTDHLVSRQSTLFFPSRAIFRKEPKTSQISLIGQSTSSQRQLGTAETKSASSCAWSFNSGSVSCSVLSSYPCYARYSRWPAASSCSFTSTELVQFFLSPPTCLPSSSTYACQGTRLQCWWVCGLSQLWSVFLCITTWLNNGATPC